jgi:hypothetical protein
MPDTGPRCGDGIVQGLETCDGLQPHCLSAACQWDLNWKCDSNPPYECHSGTADPSTELGSLTTAEAVKLCAWINRVISATVDSRGHSCNLTYTPLDCSNPGGLLLKGSLTGCHWTVDGLEKCVAATEQNICLAVTTGLPECASPELCHYAAEGEPCMEAPECQSDQCCASADSAEKHCAAACDTPVNLTPCTSDDYCGPGKCVEGKCLVNKLLPGKACIGDEWCQSGSCDHGICKGSKAKGEFCAHDYDCETGHDCCGSSCGDFHVGCVDDRGDACGTLQGYCTVEGVTCIDEAFCSVECTKDTDCGYNRWGFANHCAKNIAGKNLCFSGCQGSCEDTIGPGFYCNSVPIIENGATSGSVCSGDSFQSDDVVVAP